MTIDITDMSIDAMQSLLEQVKFDDKGLVGAIVQDCESAEVLMFAWMNRESLEKTLKEGRVCYWSRSRKKLWIKGEISGNVQKLKSLRLDCDGDTLLLAVEQSGGACHTGHRSCFYRLADAERWREDGKQIFDAAKVYSNPKG